MTRFACGSMAETLFPDRLVTQTVGGTLLNATPLGSAPTAIGSPTLSVCASIRTSVASPAFATHTAPAP